MANKDIEKKNLDNKKKSSTASTKKSTTTKKNTTKKSTTSTKKAPVKKTTNTKSSTKKTTIVVKDTKKQTTPKKVVQKKDKDLEKTIIIEDIENKINNIVEKKDVEVKEQIIEDIKFENAAKLENAKFKQTKKNKPLLAIGVIISLLGIIALIITLIANRIVDKEFISDNAITLMVIASILIECFGAFIIINES